ncbi:MAG: hypothetical protein ACE5IG_07635, partial [Dehalococcoidia bacterium]
LLPRVSVERELDMGILHNVAIANAGNVSRQIALIYRNNRRLGRSVEVFMDLVGDLYHVATPKA